MELCGVYRLTCVNLQKVEWFGKVNGITSVRMKSAANCLFEVYLFWTLYRFFDTYVSFFRLVLSRPLSANPAEIIIELALQRRKEVPTYAF